MVTERHLIQAFAEAIAHEEGWYIQRRMPTVAQRLNNPCCLPHWKDELGMPYEEVNGFVEFPNADKGWRAARAQCRINIFKRRLTFREFFAGRHGLYKGFWPADDFR